MLNFSFDSERNSLEAPWASFLVHSKLTSFLLKRAKLAFRSSGLRSACRQAHEYFSAPARRKNFSRLSQSSLVRQKMSARSMRCLSIARRQYSAFRILTASDNASGDAACKESRA